MFACLANNHEALDESVDENNNKKQKTNGDFEAREKTFKPTIWLRFWFDIGPPAVPVCPAVVAACAGAGGVAAGP